MAFSNMLCRLPKALNGSRLPYLVRGSQLLQGSPAIKNMRSPVCLSAAKSFSVTPRREMSAGHDHTKLWTAERLLSLGLLGAIPAAFITPCAALDYAVALSIVMHSHWGIEAVLVDYMRPTVVGPVLAKLSIAALYAVSIMTLGGLFYFTYSDVGLTNAVKMLWKL
ncbi:hypothetical protein B566_EDAN015157 [Ephemera danica]|nr:hypothetical protein B566_EDAN015157 [Ephemera danica]